MSNIIKREGKSEMFDERKIYASCYASCLEAGREKEIAENTCDSISKKAKEWSEDKNEVTSDDIFRKVIEFLDEIDRDASIMYETHRDR